MNSTDKRWIRNRIALYLRFTGKVPPAAEASAWIDKTIAQSKKLRALLAHCPPQVGVKAHGLFHSDRAAALVAELRALEHEAAALAPLRDRPGRKHAGQRDHLLADVATYLIQRGMTAIKAAEVAKTALDAEGIKTPKDLPAIAAIVRRTRPDSSVLLPSNKVKK